MDMEVPEMWKPPSRAATLRRQRFPVRLAVASETNRRRALLALKEKLSASTGL
jgi:hypothetical protein